MSNLADVFNDDAFSLVSLTDAVSKIDHVPGQAGELTFAGAGQGVPATKISIEYRDTLLSIIPTSPRGAPAPQETRDKAKLIALDIPQVKLEENIGAHSLQNLRSFGNGDLVEGAQSVVNEQLSKMTARLDLTLEHLRLGALKGVVLDADDSTILDLFSAFGVSTPDPVTFPSGAASEGSSLRVACQAVVRQVQRAAKLLLPRTAQVAALCGDDFFDELVSHPDVTVAYQGWQASQSRLADDATQSPFVFGGIAFSNYRGTDAITGEETSEGELTGQVGIATGECRIFLTGVPGLYTEKFAPADFLDSVNAIGLPRYAKIVPDAMGRSLTLHVQSNPLPICTRPATLIKGSFA